MTRGKLTVGIGFHTSTLLVSVYCFTSVSHDLQWSTLQVLLCNLALTHAWLIRSSWVVRRCRRLLSAQYWARLLRKVLGRYQYHPILASMGQYPIPQYRYCLCIWSSCYCHLIFCFIKMPKDYFSFAGLPRLLWRIVVIFVIVLKVAVQIVSTHIVFCASS